MIGDWRVARGWTISSNVLPALRHISGSGCVLEQLQILPSSPFSPTLAFTVVRQPFLLSFLTSEGYYQVPAVARLGCLYKPVGSLNSVHTSHSSLIKASFFEPLEWHPVPCCDLDFTLKYLAPGSLSRVGPSPTAAIRDVFHQSGWNHFSACIAKIIPTSRLLCLTFPKFRRIRGHLEVMTPILDPRHLVTTVAFPKQE